MIESEKRYYLPETVMNQILGLDINWSGPNRVTDITFGKTGADSVQTSGWIVRVRQVPGKITLEYKAPLNSDMTAWEEVGFEIGDLNACVKLLTKIGLNPGLVLDRVRKEGIWRDVKITIDEFQFLGNFLELEVTGSPTPDFSFTAFFEHFDLPTLKEAAPYGKQMMDALKSNAEMKGNVEDYINRILVKPDLQ